MPSSSTLPTQAEWEACTVVTPQQTISAGMTEIQRQLEVANSALKALLPSRNAVNVPECLKQLEDTTSMLKYLEGAKSIPNFKECLRQVR